MLGMMVVAYEGGVESKAVSRKGRGGGRDERWMREGSEFVLIFEKCRRKREIPFQSSSC